MDSRKVGDFLAGFINGCAKNATNIEGLFACGNAVGGLLQVCKSTYEGAKAGLSAANYVMNNK
jgi:thioredoxin reductase (NADPH)